MGDAGVLYANAKALHELLQESRAENAKLREERREYQATIDSLVDECTDHKAENAKLRELVYYIMHQCDDGNPRCDECIDWNGGECVALLRIRELGIEV